MKPLHVLVFFCFSVVGMEASEVLEVSGRVGGEVSIHCSGSWNRDSGAKHNSMYFCKGVCSSESILIQSERRRSTVISQGRYSINNGREDGVFNVAIKKLEKADTGRYRCGVEKTLNVLYQEINLIVVEASTVPRSPSSSTIIPNKTALLSHDSFTSSTEQSPAPSSPSDGKRNRHEASRLTDTTMVIIVSGSLALLVCAIIPVIFYGHWRSHTGPNRDEDNKGEGDHREENTDVASGQVAVELQAFDSDAAPETDDNYTSEYAAIYQAQDPQTMD
ncbi:Rho guanine nucleotide exchange factor 19 [Sarotherodon galilaeus]